MSENKYLDKHGFSTTADWLKNALNKKSNTTHTHDERYYTEDEVNSMLLSKSDTTHTHAWKDIQSKPDAFTPAAHKHTISDISDFPSLGTASAKDVPSTGNASNTQVVMGNDTRLTNARPASDVPAWAKATNKPSYSASEVGLGNVGNFKAVSTVASQGLTDTEKANARANIGAGTSSFSGSYKDLSNKPAIPTVDTELSSTSTNAIQNKVVNNALAGKANSSHTHDDRYYTESEMNTKLAGKANSSHTHSSADITSLDASKITGVLGIDQIPKAAVERLKKVKTDAERFALTTEDVQTGDTVKVTDTKKMYLVIDDTKLSSEAGYEPYTAESAASVPWSGVTGKPSSFTPSAHTHTKSQITDFPSSLPANGGNSSTVNGHTVNSNVPANAKFTDTNTWIAFKGATANAAGTAGYIPAPAAGDQNKLFRADGSWIVPNWSDLTGKPSSFTPSAHTHDDRYYTESEIDTKLNGKANSSHTHSQYLTTVTSKMVTDALGYTPPKTDTNTWTAFKGATASAAGTAGYAPAPAAGAANRYLRSDGTWAVPPDTNTTYNDATTSARGLMTAAMVTKLNGIASGATAVTASTVSGWGFKTTDTNTWRGIQNNLTSDSTTDSLSAAQGKVLKGLVDGKASSSHNHTQIKYCANISSDDAINNFLEAETFKTAFWTSTSSPGVSNGIILSGGYASDTYGFQLAIDDDPTYYMALRQKSVNGWSPWKQIPMSDGTGASGTWNINISGNATTATSAGNADTLDGKNASDFANASHTHNYAGSSSAGGAANSAVSVVDYNDTSKTIKIGFAGAGATTSNLGYIAGYLTGGTQIKDVSKDTLKSWLGLGSAAYTGSDTYATASHSHNYLPLSGGTISGSIKFQSSSLPSKELQYICGIDAFANGGEMGWQSKDDFLSNCSKVNHTHTKSQIRDFPTSLPASDVPAWAKAASKPSYSWDEITGKPSSFNPASHNHSTINDSHNGSPISLSYAESAKSSCTLNDYYPYWNTNPYHLGNVKASNMIVGKAEALWSTGSTGLKVATTGYRNGVKLNFCWGTTLYDGGSVIFWDSSLVPQTNGNMALGSGSARFGQIYSSNSAISTSDRKAKEDIVDLDDKYAQLFHKLKPVSYKLKDGTSGRTHTGFIAQDIEDSIIELGMTGMDLGAFCKDKIMKVNPDLTDEEKAEMKYEDSLIPDLDEDGNEQYTYSLRYEEFIAILTKVIQNHEKEIADLKEQIAALSAS